MEIKNLKELIKKLLKEKSITVLKIQKYLGIGYPLASRILSALDENGYLLSLSEKEKVVKKGKIEGVIAYITALVEEEKDEEAESFLDENGQVDLSKTDSLFKSAVEFVIKKQKVSVAAIQREFQIGYARAARMVDMMESLDLISDSATIPRIVFVTKEDFEQMFGKVV